MQALIQRVQSARVDVAGETVGAIDQGLLALIGIERDDTADTAERTVQRMLAYRVFADEQGHMNRSLVDVAGGLLLVSQFTLAADTRKGLRPSFSSAAPPAAARDIFARLVDFAVAQHPTVATGRFGADMQVHLINDGPVTFLLEVR